MIAPRIWIVLFASFSISAGVLVRPPQPKGVMQEQNRTSSRPSGSDRWPSKQDDKKKLDPIFEGWEKPQFALFLTGGQDGYIEPCGCTGLENQKGGLLRRDSLRKQLIAKGWKLVPLDAGKPDSSFWRATLSETGFDLERDDSDYGL